MQQAGLFVAAAFSTDAPIVGVLNRLIGSSITFVERPSPLLAFWRFSWPFRIPPCGLCRFACLGNQPTLSGKISISHRPADYNRETPCGGVGA